jgi:O-antigen/teichoic acid export membrane protein
MLEWLLNKFHFLKDRPYLKKIVKNTWWIYLDKFSRLLVSLFVGIFIVRQLGPASFGEFSFTLAIVGMVSPLAAVGISSILTREFVKFPKKRGVILGSALAVRLIAAIICVIGLFFFMYFSGIEATLLFMSVLFSLSLIFDSTNSLAQLFDADLKSKLSIICGQIVLVISTILKIILLVLGLPVVYFVLVSLIESILSAVILWFLYKQNYSTMRVSFDFEIIKKLAKSGLPFMLAGLGTILYMHADQVVVGYMLPVASVGFYAVAVKLSEFFYFIPAAISTSVFPKLVLLGKEKSPQYMQRLQDFFDLMTLMSLVILIPLSLLSPFIINLMYGPNYSSAAQIFSVYVISGIFIFFGFAANNHLIVEDHGKITLYRSVLGAVLNVLLSIVFVYYFGLIGAAFATLVCFGFTFWASFYLFKETRFLFFMFIESFNFPRIVPMIMRSALSKRK